jgi:hypothetical protein
MSSLWSNFTIVLYIICFFFPWLVKDITAYIISFYFLDLDHTPINDVNTFLLYTSGLFGGALRF